MESDYLKNRREIMLGIKERPVKEKAKPIKPLSKKREVLQKEYRKLVKQMLAENKVCQIKATGCTGTAEGLHHIVKRSAKNLIDKNNLLRACNSCNLFLETNDAWAREKGFVKSKHIKP